MNNLAHTVIGVLPKTMQYPSTADFFLPFAPTDAQLSNRSDHDYFVIGRLRKGVTPGHAQAELNTIADHLSHAYPATNQGWSVKVDSLLAGINGEFTNLYFSLVQGATIFVLLVVCANIANLQFARGIARRPEIAMRAALGAGRGRLMRQLLTENILLGLLGGAGGLIFAAIYMHICEISMPERVARVLIVACSCGGHCVRICSGSGSPAHQPGGTIESRLARCGWLGAEPEAQKRIGGGTDFARCCAGDRRNSDVQRHVGDAAHGRPLSADTDAHV